MRIDLESDLKVIKFRIRPPKNVGGYTNINQEVNPVKHGTDTNTHTHGKMAESFAPSLEDQTLKGRPETTYPSLKTETGSKLNNGLKEQELWYQQFKYNREPIKCFL